MRSILDRRPRSDDGTMAMYLLIAMVGLAIGALMVPMVITSARATRSDTSRGHAIDAARTGQNVMLAQIRSAKSTDGVGSSTLLPCAPTSDPNSALSGVVNSNAKYQVWVDYYMNDPVKVPGATPMRCVAGYGTYDPVSGAFTPRFARITAKGTDGTAVNGSTPGRTLVSTYTFKTTNSNIVGGQIRIYPAGGSAVSYCMDAGSAPSAGATVVLQPCATPPTDQQIFAYRDDLTLQLVSSVTSALSNGLCLDTAGPAANGNSVVLNNCGPKGTPPYTQQWSYNDVGGYTASKSTSKADGGLSGSCIGAASQNAGIALTLLDCGGGNVQSPAQSWIPNPAVGAGAAATPQLINYYEFGRCMDVTNGNPTINHLIDYPCKQNPFPNAVRWNQKFTPPPTATNATSGTGQITATLDSTTYCLTSPVTNNAYVTMSPCVNGQGNQTWTVYNGDKSLPYSTKYQIVDSTGTLCLGLTDPVTGEDWSAIDVETCSGSIEQKWNAAPDLILSSLNGITEPTNGGS